MSKEPYNHYRVRYDNVFNEWNILCYLKTYKKGGWVSNRNYERELRNVPGKFLAYYWSEILNLDEHLLDPPEVTYSLGAEFHDILTGHDLIIVLDPGIDEVCLVDIQAGFIFNGRWTPVNDVDNITQKELNYLFGGAEIGLGPA